MTMNKFIKKYGQFIIGLMFTLYFLYTFSNALDIGKEVVIATILTIVIYIQSVGEFFYFYKRKGRPRLQDWMRVALFISLVLNFMKIVNTEEGTPIVSFSVTTISLLDSPLTMTIIILSMVSLDIAYFISNIFKKPKVINIQYKIKHKTWVFGILIVSTLIQTYLLLSGISGYGSDLQYTAGFVSLVKVIAGILNPFALIISAYILFIENSYNITYRIIFYIALIMQVLLGLLSGMKENTLIPIIYVCIVFLISGRKLPRNLIYIGIFVLALLYPLNNAYRHIINDPYQNTGSHTLNMRIAINNLIKRPLTETLETGISKYGDRTSMYPYLQYSVDIETEWDYYKNMTRYFALPIVWLVPRAVWSDKPRSDIGGVLNQKIVGYENRSAVTPTNIGWAYLEGGLQFVIVIFILLGMLFEFIDRGNHKKPIILLFYVLLFHKAIKPEWDPYFMFAAMIQTFVLYWILLKFIGIKKMVYIK